MGQDNRPESVRVQIESNELLEQASSVSCQFGKIHTSDSLNTVLGLVAEEQCNPIVAKAQSRHKHVRYYFHTALFGGEHERQ